MLIIKKLITAFLLSGCLFLCNINNVFAIDGIDVSLWQREIDFNAIKDDGIQIVYIRSSAGNSYVDGDFEKNYRKAKEANLDIGFYHFVTARSVSEAKEQARFFASVIAGKEIECRLAMDFETFRGLSKTEINDIARNFLETLKDLTDKDLVIYSDAFNARDTFDNSLFEEYPLWVAEYDVENPSVENYIGWQYTDRGRVNGIDGNVDRDIFQDEIYLTDNSPIKTPVVEDKDKNKTVYYRIHSGDTLSHIAKRYHVGLKNIIAENNIKNPNLIFPNEVLKINPLFHYQVITKGDFTNYIVKKGDTLTRISHIFDVLISNLVTWNNIVNPNLIYPGQDLILKPYNNDHLIKYTVKPNDNLSSIADDYEVSLYEIMIINNISNPNLISIGDVIYIPENYILEDEK